MHISRADLELFLDNTLPAEQLRVAVEHLRWCDACILRLSSLMQERKLRRENFEPGPIAPEMVHLQVLQPDQPRIAAAIVGRNVDSIVLHVETPPPVGVAVQLRTKTEIMLGYVVHCYQAEGKWRALVRIHDVIERSNPNDPPKKAESA
jgi:hypothetical protein